MMRAERDCKHCRCDGGPAYGWVNADAVKHCLRSGCCTECYPDRSKKLGAAAGSEIVVPMSELTCEELLSQMKIVSTMLLNPPLVTSAELALFREKLIVALTREYDTRCLSGQP